MTQSTLTDQFKCRSMHPVKDINVVIRVYLEMVFDTIPQLLVVSIYLRTIILRGDLTYPLRDTEEQRCHVSHVLDREDRVEHFALTAMKIT